MDKNISQKHDLSSSETGGDLDEFFPNVGHFAQTQDEYIRTLEKALQLLQREVEHLREQRQPDDNEHKTIDAATNNASGLFQQSSDAEDVLSTLKSQVREILLSDKIMLYYRNPQHSLSAASVFVDSDIERAIKHFDEQGVIDWIFSNGSFKFLPDMSAEDGGAVMMLAPLFLRGAAAGVFSVLFNSDSDLPENQNSEQAVRLAEAALIALDNIRSAVEIGQMNRKLAELNRQMLQSSKLASIGELAGSVAHEINSPLQILLAHLQLLESGVGNPERRLEIIKQQVRRIGEITRRLLDFARNSPLETGVEEVNVRQIIDEVLLFVNSQLNRDGIHVVCEFDDNTLVVSGSKAHLEQVLLNLVLNARDAMPEGGTITIGAYTVSNSQVLITIADTGIGISEEHLSRVFEPFFTTKSGGKGTGLGLSITKTIIEQHHGTIEIASEYGKGTTFKILLPL